MKILFNCLTMEKGGAERVLSVLSNNLVEQNDVVISTITKSRDAYSLNPRIKRLYVDRTCYKSDSKLRRIFRKISILRFVRLYKIITTENPDIIISFLPEPSMRLMALKKISKKIGIMPVVISIRTDPEKEYKSRIVRFIVKKLYSKVDGMVYQTDDAKNFFKEIIKTKNQVVIQNPVDNSILMTPKSDEQRSEVVIAVGRLEKTKNQELLIRAFNDCICGDKNNYRLEIYGEGSYRQYLEKLIDELNLRSRVFLLGQVETISEKLNEAKIFVFSSLYEGMPNALIEAMAMGLPCIATDCPCGGPRSLIKDNESGILVKNNDKLAMSKAISELMNNENKRKKLSRNALKIRDTNSVNAILGEWNALINDMMNKRNVS